MAWSQALSGAVSVRSPPRSLILIKECKVVMCLFVSQTPGSHLTDPALNELDLLVALFEEASSTCQAANNLLVGS